MEIIPFWTFVISAIIVFGLIATNKMEKVIYGIIFFWNLFLAGILIIPFFGLGITSMIYAPFLPHSILYEDQKVILTEESRGFLAPKPSPTVYINCGFFLHKYGTTLSPVFSLDSVSLKKLTIRQATCFVTRSCRCWLMEWWIETSFEAITQN